MGEIDYKHRRPADETEYLNQGKGCAIYSFILVVVIIASACIICYNIWEGK